MKESNFSNKKPSEKIENKEKEPKFPILFIDDNKDILGSAGRFFGDNKAIAFVECHSVADALKAIKKNEPGLIFLDHSLTDDGSEGLEIANKIMGQNIEIYSTTANSSAKLEYEKIGIKHVGKTDLMKIKTIITDYIKSKNIK